MLDISNKVSYAYLRSKHPPLFERPEDRDEGTRRRGRDQSKESGWCKDTLVRSSPAPEKMEVTMWEFLAEVLVTALAVIMFWRLAWNGQMKK